MGFLVCLCGFCLVYFVFIFQCKIPSGYVGTRIKMEFSADRFATFCWGTVLYPLLESNEEEWFIYDNLLVCTEVA